MGGAQWCFDKELKYFFKIKYDKVSRLTKD